MQHLYAKLCPQTFQPPLLPLYDSSFGKGEGKIAIVTGSNCGIGFRTAGGLVERGFTVIIACRSSSKGKMAVALINDEFNGNGKAVFLTSLDLADFGSVRDFAKSFIKRFGICHVLVNNAGINTTGVSR